MQYSAVLLSILLALGVIVAYRGKSMIATRTELDMAAQIQESMLPGAFPAFPDRPEFDLFASMDPAREVGGDFYDFFLIDDDHLALLIADVSDKGVPAALTMMSAKMLIHYRACQGGTLSQILGDVNNELCHKNESGMFVTVWMGILDTRDGALTCVNAGHENPFVRRSNGAFRLFQDKHGLPLGVMQGMRYQEYTLQLNPGDSIFVYTDGVPEANNPDGELYGMQRLETALKGLEDPSPQYVLKAVRADVDAFVGTAKQFDDLTMLCMKYVGKPEETKSEVSVK
jgi:sigma-B regulation protein RsbU (phosphoserine phosphatase)